MKKYARPLGYCVIVVLLALAVFNRKSPQAFEIVEASRPDAGSASRSAPPSERAEMIRRRNSSLSLQLFSSPAKAPVPPPPSFEAIPVAPPADIKVLGWMLSEAVPYVFVEWQNESYTLSPAQSAGETYRFDRIGGGFADFTYLPTGATRQYVVSDPALTE